VTSLALDWLSGNLYWIEGWPPSIHVAAPGGRWALALLSEGLQGAAWLALCPRASAMCFVTADGGRGPGATVECAAMDGTGRRALWKRARAPTGLAFGGAGTRLYWADRGECGTSRVLGGVRRCGCLVRRAQPRGAAPRGSPEPTVPPSSDIPASVPRRERYHQQRRAGRVPLPRGAGRAARPLALRRRRRLSALEHDLDQR